MPVNSAPAKSPKITNLLRLAVGHAVDQHIHAHVDASAHAIGRAKLGHPHEHDDAQLLRPAHVDAEQPVLHTGYGKARGITVDDRGKDDQSGRTHQEGDDPFLDVVKKLHEKPGLQLGGIKPGFFVDALDQVFANTRLHIGMGLDHDFLECQTLSRGGGVHLVLPELLDSFQ